jgi:hypothetical protein
VPILDSYAEIHLCSPLLNALSRETPSRCSVRNLCI